MGTTSATTASIHDAATTASDAFLSPQRSRKASGRLKLLEVGHCDKNAKLFSQGAQANFRISSVFLSLGRSKIKLKSDPEARGVIFTKYAPVGITPDPVKARFHFLQTAYFGKRPRMASG